MTPLLVLLGGAAGAALRHLIDVSVQSWHGRDFPWGTVVVNTAGSLALGLAAGAIWAGDGPDWATALVGTGLCGALTTFSAFGHESLRLIEDGRWRAAAAHVAGSVLLAVTACTAGWEVSVALTG